MMKQWLKAQFEPGWVWASGFVLFTHSVFLQRALCQASEVIHGWKCKTRAFHTAMFGAVIMPYLFYNWLNHHNKKPAKFK